MTIKRMTKNRQDVLLILSHTECYDEAPPFTAKYVIDNRELNYEFYGFDEPKIISPSQMNRTLRDLVSEGLVCFETKLIKADGNPLPQRVKYYELVAHKERNALLREIYETLAIAKKANGDTWFTTLVEKPWTQEERNAFIPKLRVLIQKTHPDRVSGFENEHIKLVNALEFVRTEVDILAEWKQKQIQIT